jgi:hypothetical protein
MLTVFCLAIFLGCKTQKLNTKIRINDVDVAQKGYNLDSTTSLFSRIRHTDTTVLEKFREAGMNPVEHKLTKAELSIVSKAIDLLPALHKKILQSHLRSINFLDSMPNTALTSTLNPKDKFKIFDITIRAEILKQNVSEWLTEKENTCFDTIGSNIRLLIDGGKINALAYVLLHEATHIVDGSLRIIPQSDTLTCDFTNKIWSGRTIVSPIYQDNILDGVAFLRNGKILSISNAADIYTRLKQTPFASLYSRNSWHEDLAEYITLFYFTQRLIQPFRIILKKGNEIIFKYEPMKSELVKERIKSLNHFFDFGFI